MISDLKLEYDQLRYVIQLRISSQKLLYLVGFRLIRKSIRST